MNSEPVDVLGALDEAITSAEGDYVPEPVDIRKMHKARAAIAELLEADREFDKARKGDVMDDYLVADSRRAAALKAIKEQK